MHVHTWGCWDASVGNGSYHQAWQPELREPSPSSLCPDFHIGLSMYTCMRVCMQIFIYHNMGIYSKDSVCRSFSCYYIHPRVEFRLSGLVASFFPPWTISSLYLQVSLSEESSCSTSACLWTTMWSQVLLPSSSKEMSSREISSFLCPCFLGIGVAILFFMGSVFHIMQGLAAWRWRNNCRELFPSVHREWMDLFHRPKENPFPCNSAWFA